MLTEVVQRNGSREAGWVNRLFSNEVYTAEHQELKFTLHRKLLDRINLEALSSMAGERARAEEEATPRHDTTRRSGRAASACGAAPRAMRHRRTARSCSAGAAPCWVTTFAAGAAVA